MAKNLDMTNSNSDSNNILKTILIILIVAGIAYVIYYLYTQYTSNNSSKPMMDKPNMMNDSKSVVYEETIKYKDNIGNVKYGMTGGLKGNSNPIMNKVTTLPSGQIVGENDIEHFSQDPNMSNERNASCFPKEQLTADELLPQDNSSLWAQVNPSGEGSLKDRNFLQSGYHIGINTVGQTLRNANLQLRSEPPCPQVKVSPWLQATIEPDLGRKPFEIGGCA